MYFLKHLKSILSLIAILIFSCYGVYAQENSEMSSAGNSLAINTAQATENMDVLACPEWMGEGCNWTLLQGDPEKGNFDILYRIPANHTVPNHWHTSPERIIVLEGTLEVTYEGEETQILNKGDYAYGPAKKPHVARSLDGPCTLFIAFVDPFDAVPVED